MLRNVLLNQVSDIEPFGSLVIKTKGFTYIDFVCFHLFVVIV